MTQTPQAPLSGPDSNGRPGEVVAPERRTTDLIHDSKALRRYGLWFTLATGSFTAVWAGVAAVLLPNQIQNLEFARVFTGAAAGSDLQALTTLKAAVEAGTATATPGQSRLLDLLGEFDASRAGAVALVGAIGAVTTMLVQPVIGVLSDRTRSRFGRRTP